MAEVTFDADSFRAQIPQFADPNLYPDAALQGYWNIATCYVSPSNSCFSEECLQSLLNYVTAHIILFTKALTLIPTWILYRAM